MELYWIMTHLGHTLKYFGIFCKDRGEIGVSVNGKRRLLLSDLIGSWIKGLN